jgi:hypothetical protein
MQASKFNDVYETRLPQSHDSTGPVRRAFPQLVGRPDERIAPAVVGKARQTDSNRHGGEARRTGSIASLDGHDRRNFEPNCHFQMPSLTLAIVNFNAFVLMVTFFQYLLWKMV